MNTTVDSDRSDDETLPPIGLLLRTLDRRIDACFAHAVDSHGITRRQWQLLNTLAGGPTSRATLAAAVAPFLTPPAEETVLPHLTALVAEGLVHFDDDTYSLTTSGTRVLTTVAAEVRAIRERSVAGVPAEDYERTARTLRTMIDNLEVVG
ncbi:winged helix-turn-helix transcriptional regulator [Spiractinospora alimapuensis]|uniref:MarR family winged helix-turn-helix transcriptional regulator n=1 Tax=Spiractinospora alimapuensis TaxID=2820884 RepID=UPI001F3D86CC|nr:MarR family winged helix-turn-helix transcriptional regulator [Spiractinospora alimapuensis]QVQ51955.1 winged helix-turn-helix transcriptional regulator [Spiractinospora alimapuensis]